MSIKNNKKILSLTFMGFIIISIFSLVSFASATSFNINDTGNIGVDLKNCLETQKKDIGVGISITSNEDEIINKMNLSLGNKNLSFNGLNANKSDNKEDITVLNESKQNCSSDFKLKKVNSNVLESQGSIKNSISNYDDELSQLYQVENALSLIASGSAETDISLKDTETSITVFLFLLWELFISMVPKIV